MGGSVLLVRGGALGPASGLGGWHTTVRTALEKQLIQGWTLAGIVEYPIIQGPSRILKRHLWHPRRVRNQIRKATSSHQNCIVHVLDQEQAHLIPKHSPSPVLLTVHDLFIWDLGFETARSQGIELGEPPPSFLRLLDRGRLRRGIARSDRIHAISKATANVVPQLCDVPIDVLPHGIDLDIWKPERVEHSPFERGRVHFLTVGSEAPRKRLDFLMNVFEVFPSRERSKITLHRIGAESDAELAAQLARRSADLNLEMIHHGRVDDAQLRAMLGSADALLFPSGVEGFGVPVLEAMAMGCPILCSDLPAQSEIIGELPGLLSPVDERAWVHAISLIIERNHLRKEKPRIPDEGLISRASFFSLKVWAKGIGDIYDKVLKNGR